MPTPISRRPGVVSSAAPVAVDPGPSHPAAPASPVSPTGASSAVPAAGADVISNMGSPTASSTDAQKVGIPGLARFKLALRGAPAQPFSMIAGRYPDAVPLPMVLDQVGKTPQGQQAIKQVLQQFQLMTGVQIPDALVAASMAQPSRMLQALQISPAQLSAGMDALNGAFQAGKVKDAGSWTRRLGSAVNLDQMSALPVSRPEPELKELAVGLYQGDIKSNLSDAQARNNMVMAESLSRLADNPQKTFSVTYLGKTFTDLNAFLDALKTNGHEVSCTIEQRVANFANLKTKAPDGSILDVPAPLMIRTGVRDAQGQEAVVPAAHSELIIRIQPTAATQGAGIQADVKFYQGVSGTAFFPVGLNKEPSWCGRVTHDTITGEKAWEAVRLSGQLGATIEGVARAKKLWNGGYGETGVCNDSVAIIQHAVTGRTTLYPLLMKDKLLMPALRQALEDGDKNNDAGARTLLRSIRQVPSDVQATSSTASRALSSLPWAAGQEPFDSSVQARATLTG